MGALRLVTWNVLHRIHAVNWGEQQASTFPEEDARLARIAALVRGWLDDGVDVVCLQEVSGDQLAALRQALQPLAEVLQHTYPRLPVLRHPGPPVLRDPSEHLAVVAPIGRARRRSSGTFENDWGKGYLEVECARARVVSTHVSFGENGVPQLGLLGRTARAAPGPVVVAGDINAGAADFLAGLGEGFTCADLSGQPSTRLGQGRAATRTIDHVAVLRGAVTAAKVLDAVGLSDHAPVAATVELPEP